MKNPLKKKKHRFRNFLCYFATYLVVTFSMAFVMVNIAKNTFSATPPEIQVEEETTLSKVIGNIMNLQDGRIGINLRATNDNTEILLNGDLNLKIYSGFSNVDINLNANLYYNNNKFDIDLTYKEDYIYLILNDKNFKMNVSDFASGMITTLSLCGVDLGTTSDLMGSLDMSIIDDIEQNITETRLEQGFNLQLKVTDDVILSIDVDDNYNIKDIKLKETNIGGFNLQAELNFESINSGLEIIPKNCEYVDITNLSNITTAVVNTIKQNKFDILLNVNDHDVNIKVDKSNDLKIQLNTKVADDQLQLMYLNDTAYLDYSIFKLKTENVTASVGTLVDLLKQYNIIELNTVPNLDIEKLLSQVGEISIDDIEVIDNDTYIKVSGIDIKLTIIDNIC